jgi:hypothetical protein
MRPSTARKASILERAEPVSEYESDVRQGMDNIADAVRTLAGVMASVAAGMHGDTPGRQREMAGVIYADAQERFGDLLKKLDKRKRDELDRWIDGLCKGKK